MANVLNKTTGQYLRSVNEPDYPTADWLHSPDVSAFDSIGGYQSKYAVLPASDPVQMMNQSERDAVDAAEAATQLTNSRADAADRSDVTGPEGMLLRELFEVFNKRDNYIINRIEEIQQSLVDIRDMTNGSQARQNIPPGFPMATNTRTRAQAIQDYKDDINSGGAD